MNGVALAAALIAAFAAGLLVARAASKRRRKVVERITEAVSSLASGERDVRVPDDDAAFAPLASSVNRMASRMTSEIEQAREDRRTRDLVLAAMDEGVLLIGRGAEVRYANPAALRLLGRIAAESRGPHTAESEKPYVPPTLRALVDQAQSAGSVRETEIDMGRPTRTVLASAFPVGGEGLALLVLRDVTEARRVDAIRRDFVAAASHELKTPVASIQAAAETLSHALDEDPEAAHRFVGHLLRDSERLSRIVRDLLDLSRLESERASFEPVRLDALAREEVDRLAERLHEAALTLELEASPVTVRGSGGDLALLISNLLDNAVRYTKPGGRVRVAVDAVNGDARLTVSDTGIGIPGRDLPRVFERFYRVDRARARDTGGTGLGLAIVKHVAEQHGGRVEAESELGRGSTFLVVLPAGDVSDPPRS